ncbi:Translation initiation factor eIF-2B subunit delta [Armadillidium nasatum]|uniref:Translation initiation factor eIF2B subunit delta n=1 Tax=Armadillidium nasatum TaxID=96803 RepID=A0A5N5SMH6_9CRUS|nr:Translation initiation factor eIF-2B subunit delta [Armadillidium nasatum]
MVQEDNLDKLSELLDRLDATYKIDSCESTPSHGNAHSHANTNANTANKLTYKVDTCESTPSHENTNSQPNTNTKTSTTTTNKPSTPIPFKGKSEENFSLKEETLSQEEKKALRKARKEAKKSGKPVAAVVQLSSDSVDSSSAPQAAEVSEPDTVASFGDTGKGEKSKADLKRERREKQEAQRAAKLAAKTEKETSVQKSEPIQKKLSVSEKVSPSTNVPSKKKELLKSRRRLPLLEHLSIPKIDENLSSFSETRIHPAIRAAGICVKDLKIDGSLARVIATLSAVYSLIEDYHTPSSCDLSRDLSDHLSSNIAFLNACRPLSEPVNNAVRFVKKEINEIGNSVPESQAKEILLSSINSFIHQNIFLASETLVQNAVNFIEDDNVILTFGMSQLVKETIVEASKLKDNLSVVVADNPGTGSGIDFVKYLNDLKIKAHYRILSDLSQIMRRVSKVIVEAEAVVLNGAVIGHCGMAGLILLASTYSVPVIVLSHTFKFCNIDLTDSLVVNELGDPSVIVNCPSHKYRNYLENWKASPNMNLVNLMYDVTPPELINVLVTESSNYPTSVVPVIIRRNYADILGHD